MQKSYYYIPLSILLVFSIYTTKASVDPNSKANNQIVITEIIEDYQGPDGLVNHAKQLTKWLISSWDSIQTFNHTLILDTLNKGNYTKNLYRAIIKSEDNIFVHDIQENQVRYSVVLENVVNGIKFKDTAIQCNLDFLYRFKENVFKVYLMNSSLINNLTESGVLLKNPDQFENDSTLTFTVRSINFDKAAFSDQQKVYLTNLINNALISRENGYSRYNKKTSFLGQKLNFVAAMNDSEKSMANIDFILDVRFDEDTANNMIVMNFDISGKREPNVLVPDRFAPSIAFNREVFLEDETLESNMKISSKLFEFIKYQYYF